MEASCRFEMLGAFSRPMLSPAGTLAPPRDGAVCRKAGGLLESESNMGGQQHTIDKVHIWDSTQQPLPDHWAA